MWAVASRTSPAASTRVVLLPTAPAECWDALRTGASPAGTGCPWGGRSEERSRPRRPPPRPRQQACGGSRSRSRRPPLDCAGQGARLARGKPRLRSGKTDVRLCRPTGYENDANGPALRTRARQHRARRRIETDWSPKPRELWRGQWTGEVILRESRRSATPGEARRRDRLVLQPDHGDPVWSTRRGPLWESNGARPRGTPTLSKRSRYIGAPGIRALDAATELVVCRVTRYDTGPDPGWGFASSRCVRRRHRGRLRPARRLYSRR